jgi:hypothetical protein
MFGLSMALICCLSSQPEKADPPPSAAAPPPATAMIKGRAIFTGDPETYKRVVLDTSRDAFCAKKKIGSEHVVINHHTDPFTLLNVLVSIKDGARLQGLDAPRESAVLKQQGCRLEPHLLPLMARQRLRMLNADDTLCGLQSQSTVNLPFNIAIPQGGGSREVTLVPEAPFAVHSAAHPWIGAWIAVFDHPFFAVTGQDGTFKIDNVPAGKYTLEAWHEKFGTLQAQVEAASGATKTIDFTFAPKQP